MGGGIQRGGIQSYGEKIQREGIQSWYFALYIGQVNITPFVHIYHLILYTEIIVKLPLS